MARTPSLSRRELLKLSAAGVAACSVSGWMDTFAADAAKHPQRKKAVILLWMNGGPSTIDLWDLKVGHANGGPYKEIQTSAPGLNRSPWKGRPMSHCDRTTLSVKRRLVLVTLAVTLCGIAPAFVGSLILVAIAVAIAVPVGVLLAIYVSEFAPLRVNQQIMVDQEMMDAAFGILEDAEREAVAG